MKLSVTKLTLVFLLLFCLTAVAQTYEEEERDILELSFYGGVGIPGSGLSDWQDSLGAKTGWEIGMDFGYFLTPDIVLGITFAYAQFEVDTDTPANQLNHRLYNPAVYMKYYFFGEGNWAPFLRGQIGVDNAKFATFVDNPPRFRELSYDPAFAFSVGAGLHYYTSYYSGIFIQANYHYALTEKAEKTFEGVDREFGTNIGLIEIRAGINVYFGG
jgi:outer membrane protein W